MHRPPQFGFVIDQRKCIGCHACTVACKSENEVPLGKFRTWVKYVDKGTFPSVRRHFTVLRCNHCDAAPCVDICPVNALHKRKDAIVDLNKDYCIGCRACMQACPYDAIYLNDDTGTAEKCHYCAHRTELGLEPACVVVCPERAIVAGDVSDPESGIAKLIASQPTTRRKLEKGTKPRVWYVDALPEALTPGATTEPNAWLWSDRQVQPPAIPEDLKPPEDVLTTLNVDHPPVWGWHIWTYLVTKNIAAGAALAAPFLAMLGARDGEPRDYAPEIIALVFLGATLFLLVEDLGRPARFWRLLLAPNTKSWLVKGGWILGAFGLVTTASLGARWIGADADADLLRWINVPLAILTAGYSAWLFAQCRGRDLWLDPWLFWKLIARAALMGAAVAVWFSSYPRGAEIVFSVCAGIVLLLDRQHPRGLAASHAHQVMTGLTRNADAILLVIAIGLIWAPGALPIFGTWAAVAALFVHERAWIKAGQAVPIS